MLCEWPKHDTPSMWSTDYVQDPATPSNLTDGNNVGSAKLNVVTHCCGAWSRMSQQAPDESAMTYCPSHAENESPFDLYTYPTLQLHCHFHLDVTSACADPQHSSHCSNKYSPFAVITTFNCHLPAPSRNCVGHHPVLTVTVTATKIIHTTAQLWLTLC